MLRMLMFLAVVSYTLAGPAAADPYWVAYEGNDFPESEGWIRTTSAGGADRRIQGDALVLDSMSSFAIVDFYQMERLVDPEAGEMFCMEWRARFDSVEPFIDPSMSVFSDSFRAVGFGFTEHSMFSLFESVTIPFEPGVFHEFALQSSDMLTYELRIDGVVERVGTFEPVFEASRVGWGDGSEGGRSNSRWDYFRFGVVPEPSALLGALAVCLFLKQRRSGHRPDATYSPIVRSMSLKSGRC